MTIPRIEFVLKEFDRYQENIEKYKECKAAKWKPDASQRKDLEAQAQAAWKVCAEILSSHKLNKRDIQQIKKDVKDQLIQERMSQLEGEKLRKYQKHEGKYKEHKASKWDNETSPHPDLREMRYIEDQAQAAWKVCERILLEHGLSQRGIQQIKREAKVLSREKFRNQNLKARDQSDSKGNTIISDYQQ